MGGTSPTRGGLWFLAGVLGLYGIAFLLDPGPGWHAAARSGELLGRLAPALVILALLPFVTHLLLSPDRVLAHLGKDAGPRGWLLAPIYAGKLLRYPEAVARELKHPVKLTYFPTISISLILPSIGVLPLSAAVAAPLWLAGTGLHLALTL
jgi:tellurite resistance protein